MQTSVGPSTAAGHALLLAQLRNTMRAIHDMHHSAGRLHDAERIRVAAMDKLTTVRENLQELQTVHTAAPVATPAQAKPLDAAPREETEMEQLKRLAEISRPPAGTRFTALTTQPASRRAGQYGDKGLGRSR